MRLSAYGAKIAALAIIGSPFLSVIALIGCSKPPGIVAPAEDEIETIDWFEDVTDRVGLDFVHDPGPTGTYFVPQIIGSGAAFFDFDGDGLMDIYLLQNGGPNSKSINRLYRQLPGGQVQDVTEGSGLGIAGHNMGVAIGDVNNDGLPDVLVTQYGGIKLFLNLGNGKFEDVTEESGLRNVLWGSSAAFFDYDRDGLLDLIIVNYFDYDAGMACIGANSHSDFCPPNKFKGTASKLFRNLGGKSSKTKGSIPRVQFEDVSFASGIAKLTGPGLGVVCADFNGDGWPDIFVTNDAKPNWLWINQKNGTFKEEAISRGVAYTGLGQTAGNMGIAMGDIDNKGMLDLYVTHTSVESNTLWSQGPRGVFRDHSAQPGLLGSKWRGTGFGTLMADFNHDGFLDIAVVNGRVDRGSNTSAAGLDAFWEPYAQRNQLFANDGTGKFLDVSPKNRAFSGSYNVGRGLACADFDNDGSPDLLVTAIGGRARLYRNVVPNKGHWIKIRAIDPKLNRDAYGAEVRVNAEALHMFRVVNTTESYLSSSSPIAHFGLGNHTHIDSIEITWPGPDSIVEVFSSPGIDRFIELKRGQGKTK